MRGMGLISNDELVVRLLLTGYRGLVRPALFTSASGDPEEIHSQVIALLSELPDALIQRIQSLLGARRNPIEVAGIRFPGRVGVAGGVEQGGGAAPRSTPRPPANCSTARRTGASRRWCSTPSCDDWRWWA